MNVADYSETQLDLFEICGVPVMDRLQDFSFGRMSPEPLAATKGWILEPCLKKSQRPRFQCLQITNGQTQGWSNGMEVRLRGESSTRNIGASPSVVVESFLSQILEDTVPEKYFLSARACEGILRRAEKRGKDLPPELKTALEAQASCECVPDAPGGGKGALISKEKSLSLLNHNDQTLFVPDKARSLTARNDGSPCVDRGPEIVAAGFKAGAGADAGGLGYQVEQMPTLTSAESGTQRPTVAVYGVGVENGIAGTLDASYYKGTGARSGKERTCVAVYDMTHADEVMRKVPDGRIPTLNARMGTGGNQVPVVHTYTVCCKTVRRLTPTECERLQGLPDGYTLVGNASDTQRYKALGNGMAQPCADYVIRRIVEVTT